jgi:hypothetical protein
MLHRPVGEGRTSDLVDRLRVFYSARPGGPFIVFSPWPTDDLRPYGFELVGHPPLREWSEMLFESCLFSEI